MNVIIAGGRDFNNYTLLKKVMQRVLVNTCESVTIVCGKARGADSLGEQYAKEENLNVLEFPANWDKYGKSAGYRRNEQMALNADALVAFWDGKSKGTKHMIDIASREGLKIRVFNYKGTLTNAEIGH